MQIGSVFKSYTEFKNALFDYERSHFVNFVTSHSKPLVTKNKKLREKFRYDFKVLRCKYGGKPKTVAKIRATNSYKKFCESQLRISYDKRHFVLRVTKLIECHNHELNQNFYNAMPKQRILTGENREIAKKCLV